MTRSNKRVHSFKKGIRISSFVIWHLINSFSNFNIRSLIYSIYGLGRCCVVPWSVHRCMHDSVKNTAGCLFLSGQSSQNSLNSSFDAWISKQKEIGWAWVQTLKVWCIICLAGQMKSTIQNELFLPWQRFPTDFYEKKLWNESSYWAVIVCF